MSIIRPVTINSIEVPAHLTIEKQFEAASLHELQFNHDAHNQALAHSLDYQENIHKSENKNLNDEYMAKDHNILSSQRHQDHEDKTMRFYTIKEGVKPSVGSKRLDDDNTPAKESDDSCKKEDDCDESLDSSKSTHQSLISHAGQVIGQAIGQAGFGGLFFSGNSSGSKTGSSEFSAVNYLAQSQVASPTIPLEVDSVSQSDSSEAESAAPLPASTKISLSDSEGNTVFGAMQSTSAPITLVLSKGTGGDASLSSSSTLQQGIPTSVAEAVRSARFSDSLMNELTASVNTLRLNRANGQDMTLNLRSDVLEATSIHITGNATHMTVDFSTANAASNLLLNTHLTTLQNHLTELCPGQVVDIRTQFVGQASLRDFTSDSDSRSRDDLASFDQGNRGSRNNDDAL